jgi:hypothetical protein
MDDETLKAAFAAHKVHAPIGEHGRPMFTRRMVINLAHMADCTPRQMVKRCERMGLCKRGSWEWFQENGGFTKEHFEQAAHDRRTT